MVNTESEAWQNEGKYWYVSVGRTCNLKAFDFTKFGRGLDNKSCVRGYLGKIIAGASREFLDEKDVWVPIHTDCFCSQKCPLYICSTS